MLSASRQIATRRLDSFLVSVEVTVSSISLRDSAGLTRFAPTQRARLHKTSRPSSRSFHGVALLASERILNAMMSWTIVTQVQAEVQAASTVTPWILLSRRQNPLLRPVVTINVQIKADGMVLSLRWGCREHFVSGCWHSLPQGVLVIY